MKKIFLSYWYAPVFPSFRREAQYVRVNYDKKTVAAMAAAYATETATEAYYTEQSEGHTSTSTVLRKWLRRVSSCQNTSTVRALTELGIWSDGTENYYYRRIYHPRKCEDNAEDMDSGRSDAPFPADCPVYWGSYLMKVCAEVKALCMQFESVVTNGTLSFRDVVFLEICHRSLPRCSNCRKAAASTGKPFFDDLGNIQHNFTKENLKTDIDNLYNMGVGLAQAGADNFTDAILGGSSFHDLLNGEDKRHCTSGRECLRPVRTYGTFRGQYAALDGRRTGGSDQPAIQTGNYKPDFVDKRLPERSGRAILHPTVVHLPQGCRHGNPVRLYAAHRTTTASFYSGEWTRFNTSDAGFYPNNAQTEQILSNSERYAGWSRAQVEQMNRANDGYTYGISYYRSAYNINLGSKLIQKAYAYSIKVTRSWNSRGSGV